jgi:hypothetical protein
MNRSTGAILGTARAWTADINTKDNQIDNADSNEIDQGLNDQDLIVDSVSEISMHCKERQHDAMSKRYIFDVYIYIYIYMNIHIYSYI